MMADRWHASSGDVVGCDDCNTKRCAGVGRLRICFFFQAEDGIRDVAVTGVQTCALPIFYRVLAAQELLEAQRDLARIAQDNAETEHRLSNTGQADRPEVLQAEVEARRRQMAVHVRENTLRQEWRGLTAVIGKPDLALQVVDGNLEADLPRVNEEEVVEAIAKESPAVRIAAISTTRAQAVLERSEEHTSELQSRLH